MLVTRLGLRPMPLRSVLNFRFSRLNSNLPQNFNPKKDLPSQGEWKHLKQHIPGEAAQTNDLRERIPKFPLTKENVPTLLPRPGVPRVGPKMTFRQVIHILKSKSKPELIYEAEPHRLYFLACFCCAVVFAVYGCVLLEFAWFQANKDYDENKEELAEPLRKREFAKQLVGYSSLGALALFMSYHIATFPTRLIRRMWYLPGPVEHVRFTSYSLIPGRPTPVITVPLHDLARKHQARVWTGKGFYGTSDKSLFFFVLKEISKKKTWIVDRRGFFWSDGRVFDILFGKETIAEAEAGIPYDEQIGIVNREVKKKKKELRAKHGMFYQWKLGALEVKGDLNKATNYVKSLRSGNDPKGLPKDKQ
ncbi:CIC11C00000003516 [Sungouiella intermedia]|uniref:CIC11C00000003516 n=1 Tax=Sungouiella intermedia TaxID=45354 RepID=A0A1L0DHE3_9ASCO|nr:CIC11C00000003516 [[Candida] intermedia]